MIVRNKNKPEQKQQSQRRIELSKLSPKNKETAILPAIPKNMEIKYKKDMQQLKFYRTLNNFALQ